MEAKREYKATLFSELFNQPQRLRELYNALADTTYGDDRQHFTRCHERSNKLGYYPRYIR